MKKEIKVTLELDTDQQPKTMQWDASDATGGAMPCKAIQLSVWDPTEQAALRVDLWTKDMYIEEMNHFYFQTIMTMASSFEKATGNSAAAEIIKKMGEEFGKKTEVLKN